MWNKILFVAMVLVTASAVEAQGSDSSLYLRAQEMVANGDAASGRALVDSVLSVTSPDSVQYAEALYWRATLSTSATSAEQDYRRIIVDYSMSQWVDKALLRIGQLELTRGDYDEALQHLQRISAEHPGSELRAKANYWIARALFEKNDVANACAANTNASALVSESDIELKNQIEFQSQRCRNVVSSVPKAGTSAAATPIDDVTSVDTEKKVSSSAKGVSKTPKVTSKVTKQKVPQAVEAPSPSTGGYRVQVAAYYDRSQAYDLVTKLHTRGYQTAHVEGEKAPYRVRIGPFSTRATAAKMLAALQEKKISGFIVKE